MNRMTTKAARGARDAAEALAPPRRQRRVKVLATLGPASLDDETVRALYEAGADLFRINMSHSDHDTLRARVAQIRALEAAVGRPVGVLADLQGPKLRLGTFAAGPHRVEVGDVVTLDSDPAPGDGARVHLPHPEILNALKVGDAILVDDGRVKLRTLAIEGEGRERRARTRVEVAGKLSDRKGVSLPDTDLPVSALTAKDRSDLEAALDAGVDWIALSFVQRAEDVAEVKKVARGRAAVMAKIEKPQAIPRLAAIMEAADAIMVARGDLGVELPVEKVPALQKRMTRLARRLGKPVVIATQMLESMIEAPLPTRAEVSDVATAVFEGADAVMLSAESAAGKFPLAAVAQMDRIAIEVEQDDLYRTILDAQRATPEATGADAIAAAAREMADTLDMKALVAWTSSGATGLRLARERPRAPVLALTPNVSTARMLTLVWGVHPVVTKDASDPEDMVFRGAKFAVRERFAKPGDRIVVVAGVPFGTPGATNTIRIAFVTAGHAAAA